MKKFKVTKITLLFISLIFTLGLFVGCSDSKQNVKDRSGNEFIMPKNLNRIISTAPTNTEILVGLGLGDKIIATDEYSKDVKGVKNDITRISIEKPDPETIISLKPDLVVASEQNIQGGEDQFKSIKDMGIPVVYIPSSKSFEEIYKDIEFLGKVTGTENKANEMISGMKSEVEKIKKIGDKIKDKKSVYFEIGPAPTLYSFGSDTFLNDMIEIVGAKNIFANQKGWIQPSEEAVVDKNPDVILTNVNYVKDPIKEIKSRKGWSKINAVKDNRVYSVDTNTSSRASQFSIEALKEIAKEIYPDEYKNQ